MKNGAYFPQNVDKEARKVAQNLRRVLLNEVQSKAEPHEAAYLYDNNGGQRDFGRAGYGGRATAVCGFHF